jgi:hypothetical protein
MKNSKKPTRFQNHAHGQARSVIPFLEGRALLSESGNDVKKIFHHHILPKLRKNRSTFEGESIDFCGPFMLGNAVRWR